MVLVQHACIREIFNGNGRETLGSSQVALTQQGWEEPLPSKFLGPEVFNLYPMGQIWLTEVSFSLWGSPPVLKCSRGGGGLTPHNNPCTCKVRSLGTVPSSMLLPGAGSDAA